MLFSLPPPTSRLNRSLEVGYGWGISSVRSVLYWGVDCSTPEGRCQYGERGKSKGRSEAIEQTSGCLIVLYYNNLNDKESVSIVPV